MTKIIPVTALLLALLIAPAQAQTAGEMLSWCSGVARTARVTTNGNVSLPPTTESGMCWGAFTALQQSLVYSDSDGKPLLGVCAPAEGTRLQLVQVFSSYARQHPEKHHYEFMDMALIALSAALPCQ
jgi:hypothetical protein